MRKLLLAVGFGSLVLGCGDNAVGASDAGTTPVDTATVRASLRLEEICPGNIDFEDERGEDPGWVEIRNLADSAVPLGAWRLRGTAKDGSWRLPDSLLPAGGRLAVFLSGLDRRRIVPPGDTVKVFAASGYAWSDSLNDPPGHSRWSPWEMSTLFGKLADGTPAISAEMVKADNSATGIEWSSVSVVASLPGGAATDVSGRDRLVLVATIPAGQYLDLRFCEEGSECWKGAAVQVRGTGVERDRYEVSLLGVSADFSRLKGVSYEPPPNSLGTFRFTVTGLFLYRSALHPHASFELSRKGSVLSFEDTAGKVSETVAYPKMADAESYVRDSATGIFHVRKGATPETSNPAGEEATVPGTPVFRTAPGFHDAPLRVLLDTVAGATVRCAEDGAAPTASSPSADTGIVLDSSAALRCAAFAPDGTRGEETYGTFLVGESISLPVIAVTADSNSLFQSDTGIYAKGPSASSAFPYFGANFWKDVEIPAHVEMFENGSLAFSLPAGIGIFGNYSRAYDKKSLSVQFREKYGARRVEWPLFPGHPERTGFKGFGLRNGGNNCGKDYVRDALATSLTEPRGLEYQLSRHVVVFLNGRYWGLYELREKLDADYLETRYGTDPDAVDMVKNGSEVQAGTATAWNALIQRFMKTGFADSAGLVQAKALVDVDNYADYLAAEMWASNTDWPSNNVRVWSRNDQRTPWRHMLFDMDFGLNSNGGEENMLPWLLDSSVATDGYPNGEYSTVIFRRLASNPAWRERFVNRMAVQLSTGLSTARVRAALDSMQGAIAAEVPRDQARWGFSAATQANELRRIRSFAGVRPGQVRDDFRNTWGLGADAAVSLAVEGGTVEIDGIAVGTAYSGTHYAGHSLNLRAVSASGATFVGWSDGETAAERRVEVPEGGLTLTATFR